MRVVQIGVVSFAFAVEWVESVISSFVLGDAVQMSMIAFVGVVEMKLGEKNLKKSVCWKIDLGGKDENIGM